MTEPLIIWREDGLGDIHPPFTPRYNGIWLEIEGWHERRRKEGFKLWIVRADISFYSEKQASALARTLKTLALMRYEQRSLSSQQANINQL